MKSVKNQLDPILTEIGEFGKYQILTTILLMVVAVVNYFSIVIYVFEALLINHRCFIDNCDNDTTNYNPTWLIDAVPFEDNHPVKCLQFQKQNSSCNSWNFNRSIIEHCNRFVYETTEKSILQDFNLQCDENVATLTFVGTLNGIGKFIGLPLAGYLSDKLGRKKLLIVASIISGMVGIARSFSKSYILFLVLETLDAFVSAGVYASIYVLGSELVGPKKRALITTMQFIAYSLGGVILGSVAWLVQSWRLLLQILYPINLITILYIWLIPESIRWLLVNNKFEQAKTILNNIAKTNKKQLSEENILNLAIDDTEELDKVKISLKHVFKSKVLVIRVLVCSFCWISCIFVYYGLTISATSLSDNHYLDFVLTSAVEIPSYIIAHLLVTKIRRKIMLSGSFILSSISSTAFIVLPLDLYWVQLSLYLISKVGISIVAYVIYMATNEMFPTSVRQTLVSICSMFGRVGNILVPQLILLQQIWFNLPLLLFAVLSAISGVLVLLLPETKDTILPNTIEEAENIGNVKT
ncbi:hypothetical protein FQR65_LT08215 [Abscondita terminalis]|nr:hypothetical protein FQR65_LT08215 [Abscondita terminalis]